MGTCPGFVGPRVIKGFRFNCELTKTVGYGGTVGLGFSALPGQRVPG